MIQLIHFLLTLVTTSVRSRLSLQTENATLRNQLYLYRRSGQRPGIRPADRLLWCFIAKFWAGWRAVLYFGSAQDHNNLAENAIPRLLARTESVDQNRSTSNFARAQKAYWANVGSQPDVGRAEDRR